MADRASSVILRMKQMSSPETQSMRAEEWSLGAVETRVSGHNWLDVRMVIRGPLSARPRLGQLAP